MTTLLLDTTVLCYAVGNASHPLAAPARALLMDIRDGAVRATTTPEVLQEFLHVHSRRRPRTASREFVQRFADALSPLLVVDEQAVRRAADEYVGRTRIGAFDAVLVALAIDGHELELVTADGDLLALQDVPVRDLASFG